MKKCVLRVADSVMLLEHWQLEATGGSLRDRYQVGINVNAGKKDGKRCREPGKSPAVVFIQEEGRKEKRQDETDLVHRVIASGHSQQPAKVLK